MKLAGQRSTTKAFASAGALALVASLVMASGAWAAGNSEAAHACQKGGFNSLVGTEKQTFANVGACVEYAAHGGKFASGIFNIPKGHTATFTNVGFNACDELAYGYELNPGTNNTLATKEFGCFETSEPDATLGPYAQAELVRVFLTDDTCSLTFYSDGNHAAVTASNPYHVAIADGGGPSPETCTAEPRLPNPEGNLNLTVTVQ